MAGSRPYAYDPNRAPHAESTFAPPAPPSYATFVGSHPQQSRQQQSPEVHHHDRDEDGETEQADSTHIPIDHMNLDFNECFREHKSVQTHPEIRKCHECVYHSTVAVFYNFFVLFLGILIAFAIGFINAIAVFLHVWLHGPLLKLYLLLTYALATYLVAPIRALYQPLVDASARVFRQIRVDGKLHGSYAERLARSQLREIVNV